MAALITISCASGWKLSSRSMQRKVPTRAFCKNAQKYAAHNFVMPAMSPTMTEGSITSWKVQEGESFSAGDVLLEIETDKAQMDVEAQDDGVLAKIMQKDGAKSVKVGSRIAVLAEEDDDLPNLQIPPEEPPSGSPAQKPNEGTTESSSSIPKDLNPTSRSSKEPNVESRTSRDSPRQSYDSITKHRYSYPLYPSVMHLLHRYNVSEAQLKEISPTGPGGRLLKGDILSYLNRVSKAHILEQSERISKLGHLDLSNIKVASEKAELQIDSKREIQPVEEESDIQVSVPISLSAVNALQERIKDSLGLVLPVYVFIARASEMANDDLPRARGVAPTVDELFDALLGRDLTSRATRGHYTPKVTDSSSSATVTASSPSRELDIIDILIGPAKKPSSQRLLPKIEGVSFVSRPNSNIFSLNVPKQEQSRARVYLERVKTILEAEPGRCIL